MKIQSILLDERIGAANVLVDLTIKEYLAVASDITDNNEFQRRKVIKSKIKEILREDLLKGCSIPPIVLSIKTDSLGEDFNYKTFSATDIDHILKAFEEKTLLIIDGLQRTYVMLGIEEELQREEKLHGKKSEVFEKFLEQKIRAEIYVGLDRLGILYRMITLNTGQTTMSTRHLMEILYFDYRQTGIDDIKFVTDKQGDVIQANTNEFNFKDALDGFNSYLEKDENLFERTEILDNIKTLNTLAKEEYKKDLFKEFMITYKKLLDAFVTYSQDWKYNPEDFNISELAIKALPFGKSIVEIFKRSQALTGFGAAVGYLKVNRELTIDDFNKMMDSLNEKGGDFDYGFKLILKYLDIIRDKSKKIGNDQRFFFRHVFEFLFDPNSESHLIFDQAVESAFNKTRSEKLPK
ncbi:hypothetical protein [Algoriphagus terrigena]|uniref:hypothetical protein n=1 Tax=Algoriphagus terrigena TaxID=344884 RepID=UPI000425AA5D|nr:hypothetical protein [Algoriphagus terrigena]